MNRGRRTLRGEHGELVDVRPWTDCGANARPRHDGGAESRDRVWAVELGKDVEPGEIKGTLELSDQALLFSPDQEARPAKRIALHESSPRSVGSRAHRS